LHPRDELTSAATLFRKKCLGATPSIGLHVRHGNRAPTGHAAYWDCFEGAIDRCTRAVSVARERLGTHTPVLLCTDSIEVESAIRSSIGDVVTRSKLYRQPGAGELHLSPDGRRVLEEAMIDMLLL